MATAARRAAAGRAAGARMAAVAGRATVHRRATVRWRATVRRRTSVGRTASAGRTASVADPSVRHRRWRTGAARSRGFGRGRYGGRWGVGLPLLRHRRGDREKERGGSAAASEWRPAGCHGAGEGPVAGHGGGEAVGGSIGRHGGTPGGTAGGHRGLGHGTAGRRQGAVLRLRRRGQRARREALGREGSGRCSAPRQRHRWPQGPAVAVGGEVARRGRRWREPGRQPAGRRGGGDGGASGRRQLGHRLPRRERRYLPVHVTHDVDRRRGGGRIRPADFLRHREGAVLSWFLGHHLSRWKVPVAAAKRTDRRQHPTVPARPAYAVPGRNGHPRPPGRAQSRR
jgi:hypothetical protein